MVQLPSVSTVIRLLHNTLFFARAFAITERDMVTDAGKPSGMKATITETTSIMRTGTVMKPLCCLSSQAPQRMMTITAIVRAQLAMMITNLRISRCKVVRPGASPVDNLAIRPLKHYGKSGNFLQIAHLELTRQWSLQSGSRFQGLIRQHKSSLEVQRCGSQGNFRMWRRRSQQFL
jgi:hypothetical protein